MSDLILVVDDEPKIVRLARDYLERNGYRVEVAADGGSALAAFRQDHPDLIVLDLNLPGMDGLDVCRTIRRESDVPIIMLTARVEEVDRLIGLELGADDYITKPFSPRELVARVRAVLRRVQGGVRQPDLIQAGRYRDRSAGPPGQPGWPVPSSHPYRVRAFGGAGSAPGQTLTREQLLERVHGDAYPGYDRSIDAHIANLRRKIEPDPAEPSLILTVYGVGYRFSEGA